MLFEHSTTDGHLVPPSTALKMRHGGLLALTTQAAQPEAMATPFLLSCPQQDPVGAIPHTL